MAQYANNGAKILEAQRCKRVNDDMKIFYGIQGTGNGHIARARIMAKELAKAGMEVTYLFSGRDAKNYFDMGVFGDYQVRQGLTFNTSKGHVNYVKTAFEANIPLLLHDIKSLDLRDYDIVISDFEPVCAWAAKKQKKRTIGIGNQYAYNYKIPREGSDPIADMIMKKFAPVDTAIGLHWHHFGQPILPPIIDLQTRPKHIVKNKIVVYLPFEEIDDVVKLLSPFKDFQFHISTPHNVTTPFDHITFRTMSCDHFQKDLRECAGVISNAGFALTSEALQLGKKILIKPLHSQVEQTSNAAALRQLGYARVMPELNGNTVEHWLHDNRAVHITYPNTAQILTEWLLNSTPPIDEAFIESVWSHVNILHIEQ